jgi:hypothetical protein
LAAIGSKFKTAKSSRRPRFYSRLDMTNMCVILPPIETPMPLPNTENGASLKMLHGCSEYRTLDEVQAIVERFPGCLSRTNHFGQTPLHVGASEGLRCEILLFLILSYPEACRIADNCGKLPLHYVAESSKWWDILPGSDSFCDERNEVETRDPSYSPMLKKMCEVYPLSATHEDLDGSNPIELALTDVLPDDSIVRLLQRTASNHWKELRKSQEAAIAHAPITQDECRAVAGRSA